MGVIKLLQKCSGFQGEKSEISLAQQKIMCYSKYSSNKTVEQGGQPRPLVVSLLSGLKEGEVSCRALTNVLNRFEKNSNYVGHSGVIKKCSGC